MKASIREKGTTVLPWVRGACRLISARTRRAESAAALAVSTDVPSVQLPWASGGESCRSAASRGTRPEVKSAGMSERKMGMKSARPSAIARRSGAPVKSDTERKRPAFSGSAKWHGPSVCMW